MPMANEPQLLIAEDDAVLSSTMKQWLMNSGFAVSCVESGTEADSLLSGSAYDLVILDLGLPGMDGLDVLAHLRERNDPTSVIITTARDSLSHKLHGFNAGADDYLTKPFDLSELEARIRAVLRRKKSLASNHPTFGVIAVDRNLLDGFVGDMRMFLTPTEYQILLTLVENGTSVSRKDKLCEQLGSDGEPMTENTLEVNIYRLRKKLAASGVTIKSIRGIGYCLTQPS